MRKYLSATDCKTRLNNKSVETQWDILKNTMLELENTYNIPKPFDNKAVTRCAATWPLVLELKFFLSNNVRMSKATEMCLRDHNSNNCTHRGNVCYCTCMVNNDHDKFRSFSRLYLTLFRYRTCTYLHGADRFVVSVSNGQVAALSDWAYYIH